MVKAIFMLAICLILLSNLGSTQDLSISGLPEGLNINSLKNLLGELDLNSFNTDNYKSNISNTQDLIKLASTFGNIFTNKKDNIVNKQEDILLNLLKDTKLTDISNNQDNSDLLSLSLKDLKKDFSIDKLSDYTDMLKDFVGTSQSSSSKGPLSDLNSLISLISTIKNISNLDFLKSDTKKSPKPLDTSNLDLNDLSKLIDTLTKLGNNNLKSEAKSDSKIAKSADVDKFLDQIKKMGSKNSTNAENPESKAVIKVEDDDDSQTLVIIIIALLVLIIGFIIAIFYIKKRSIISTDVNYDAKDSDIESKISIESDSSSKKMFK